MLPERVPSDTEPEKDERRKIIIALLFLLLSFGCIFCSSQSALWLIDRDRIEASMLSTKSADYGSGPAIALAPLEGDIAAEANRDEALLLLKQTPIAGGLGVVILPNPIPTPQPTLVAILPTPILTPTVSAPGPVAPTPMPVAPTSTTVAPTPAAPTALPPTAPLPTLPPATSPLPTALPPTSPPATSPPATSPPSTSPPPTSPPPTSPPPTLPPPTAPPPTSPPPTATATATPTNTPTPPAVQFSAPAYIASEADGMTLITVTLSGPSASTVTVNYATSNGTATAGSDYTGTSGVLTFAPGVTSQTFPVTILDDTLDELDETVALALSAPSGATLGAPSSATLTILDDDLSPTVQFSAPTYTVGEVDGTAPITVTLSGPSGLTVMVNYATSNGTATAGSDYTGTSGVLTFAPGVTSQTFPVPILDDMLDEPDETVVLTLSTPSGATLGAPSSATLTILDDDLSPMVQFSAPTYTVSEVDGTAPITVTLSGPSALTVTVDYASSDGTALAGSDYIPISGTLTFAPLQTSQTFNVAILDDAGEEPSETLNLTLTNPVSATITGTNPATLTIADDDPPGTGCTNPLPPPPTVDIGPPDCRFTFLAGGVITITLPTAILVTGDPNPTDYELVYYERERDPGSTGFIDLDQVTIAISTDGITWYTVFMWGDTTLDTNTNIGQAGYGGGSGEPDNTSIPMSDPPLYRSSTGPITGIAIDMDNNLLLPPPPGSYPYVRLTGGGQADVDSIEVLP